MHSDASFCQFNLVVLDFVSGKFTALFIFKKIGGRMYHLKLAYTVVIAASILFSSGCATQQEIQARQQAEEAQTRAFLQGFIDQAKRYCLEMGYKAGTQLYDDCALNNAKMRLTEFQMSQMAANPPAPVYSAPARRVGGYYPNTPAGAFAAGFNGGTVVAPPAPTTCSSLGNAMTTGNMTTFGNTTTCY